VLTRESDDLLESRVFLAQPPDSVRIGRDFRLGHFAFDFGVAINDRLYLF
jgi:hypothetical protein